MTAYPGPRIFLLPLFLLPFLLAAPAAASTCYGRPGAGSIGAAVALPAGGTNFQAYSALGVQLGRTHVHGQVSDVLLDAYTALETSAPGKRFVYGETGLQAGGRMQPHRTHQNGLSVDFMVPVLDAQGRSVPLPSSPRNKFGYGVEFDAAGRAGALRIDYAALAEHLYALQRAAHARRIGIALVIFDPALMPALLATPRGKDLRSLPFMQRKPWVRHDEHYHVDFTVPCQPRKAQGKVIKAR